MDSGTLVRRKAFEKRAAGRLVKCRMCALTFTYRFKSG
ncbi:hypothetical protein BSIN_1728 [Burkholderia singularis]|uniref:Uncharacterized protein n=1 Tax=Burkholderia singularis TaxID=1503053 RepID=A0A238GZP7_9BURK|nr:hypothetical protein BSIN_1728 [Burkholderia singularis]